MIVDPSSFHPSPTVTVRIDIIRRGGYRSGMKADTIAALRQKLHRTETGPATRAASAVSIGIDALDRLLPDGGLRPGLLLELLADGPGAGAATLALRLAAAWQPNGELLLVDQGAGDQRSEIRGRRSEIGDQHKHRPPTSDLRPPTSDLRPLFYPPAAAALGIDLRRMVVVHPANQADAVWALEQALRCRGVGMVVGSLGKTSDVVLRRLQLAVEAGGTVGVLLRPAACAAQTSWGDVRWLVRPRASPETGPDMTRRIDVELLHCRGRLTEGCVILELDDETGAVCEIPRLAAAADSGRPGRKSEIRNPKSEGMSKFEARMRGRRAGA
jgi:hypothetical protein